MRKAKENAEREIERAKQEAQRIISRTRAEADRLVEEINKARKEKELSVAARTKLRKNIDKMEAHADPIKLKNTPDKGEFLRSERAVAFDFPYTHLCIHPYLRFSTEACRLDLPRPEHLCAEFCRARTTVLRNCICEGHR